jgi:hypothetical protein
MADWGKTVAARAQPAKGIVRELFKRHISQWLWVRPRDRWLFWALPTPDPQDGPVLDILRIGSCEDRAMPDNHQANGPMGFPRFMLNRLARDGIRCGYQNLWIWTFEELPQTERELLKRRRMNRPAPDLIVFQVGPIYTGRHFLGGHRRVIGLRENLGKRIGPLIYPLWRVISKALRWRGFPTPPYPGPERLDRFLEVVKATWPDCVVALYEPTSPALEGGIDRAKLEHVADEMRAAADRHGDKVRIMPRPELGLDMRLRISNGYNVNEAGARIVGRHFADWILAQPDLVRTQRRAAGSVEPERVGSAV